jgi:magnesium transporter
MLRRICNARKRVMALMRLLLTKADVLKAVIKRTGDRLVGGVERERESVLSETTLYLGDIQGGLYILILPFLFLILNWLVY